DLLVVSQLRIATPYGPQPYFVPDLVLFINGLPVVVIECKDPGPTAIDIAINDLLNYASPDRSTSAPDLTRYAQLLVATDRESASYGTITAHPEHFAPWRSVDSATPTRVRAELDKRADHPLSTQEILAGELLRPEILLDVIRHFTVSQVVGGRQVKIVARWP